MPTLPIDDPLDWFSLWMDQAVQSSEIEPTAMSLATLREDGQPTIRIVLLKAFDRKGFVFYTNLKSAKGRQLESRPGTGLNFFWKTLGQQVRIDGRSEPISEEEADAYFESRGRGSQIGAWASRQSEPLEERAVLEQRVKRRETEFEGREVERPRFWSGFRVVPDRMEFWKAGADRLHDRWEFVRVDEGWNWERRRLYP